MPHVRRVTMIYKTPDNLIELLNGVLRAAASTEFYPSVLDGRFEVSSPEEFGSIPATSLCDYRRQSLVDVVADPARVDWIVGPYKGQSPQWVAVAEGSDEGSNRYDVFADTVKGCVSLDKGWTCAVVASPEKRYFAAEIATILISSGIPSHVFTDNGSQRTYEQLHDTSPEILVILSDHIDVTRIPPSIELCITFRRSQVINELPQLDVYVIDELGFLGQSRDCATFSLNRDMYYFERSEHGNLIVTGLYHRVQPMLRIETADKVRPLDGHLLEFTELSAFG